MPGTRPGRKVQMAASCDEHLLQMHSRWKQQRDCERQLPEPRCGMTVWVKWWGEFDLWEELSHKEIVPSCCLSANLELDQATTSR